MHSILSALCPPAPLKSFTFWCYTNQIITSAKEDMFVCLLATLRKKFQMDLHEIFWEGWQWVIEEMTKFWL